jgi:hypothetical protein
VTRTAVSFYLVSYSADTGRGGDFSERTAAGSEIFHSIEVGNDSTVVHYPTCEFSYVRVCKIKRLNLSVLLQYFYVEGIMKHTFESSYNKYTYIDVSVK